MQFLNELRCLHLTSELHTCSATLLLNYKIHVRAIVNRFLELEPKGLLYSVELAVVFKHGRAICSDWSAFEVVLNGGLQERQELHAVLWKVV